MLIFSWWIYCFFSIFRCDVFYKSKSIDNNLAIYSEFHRFDIINILVSYILFVQATY